MKNIIAIPTERVAIIIPLLHHHHWSKDDNELTTNSELINNYRQNYDDLKKMMGSIVNENAK